MISGLAGRQHGVVARFQLLADGVSAEQIKRRLASGRLIELHRGVYLAGTVAPAHAHEMAAILAYKLEATLSHRSAAALWKLLRYPAAADAWVTIAPERSASRPKVNAVRARLERRDVRRREAMPVTGPPRTILDCATLITDPYELERLVAEASYRGLASEAELRGQLERNPGKRGNRALRSVLDLPGGPRRTRSPGERALLRLLRERQIEGYRPTPRRPASRSTSSGGSSGWRSRSTAGPRIPARSRSGATASRSRSSGRRGSQRCR